MEKEGGVPGAHTRHDVDVALYRGPWRGLELAAQLAEDKEKIENLLKEANEIIST
jgi:hypothetical protein